MPTPLFKNLSLERLSEVFGYIKAELDKKVTVVNGKGLSTNDYTTTEKNKLSGIASGAEVNVQSNWSETNTSSDAYILNKPTKLSQFTNDVGYTTNIGTVTQVKVGSTAYNPSSGVVSLPAYPTVPTKVSQLTNDAGYTTNIGTVTQVKVGSTAYNPSSGVVSLPAYPTVPTKTSQLTNDSDFISGTVSESATASTIVKRNSSGYIYATYYNQSSSVEAPTTSSNWVFVNSDGWFRKSSFDSLRSLFGEYTAYIPESSSPAAGWRRICKIAGGKAGYANGFLAISGGWNNGAPGSAIIAITAVHTGATMTLLSNNRTDTMIQQIRLVNISGNNYWVDAYMHSQSSGVSTQYFRFSGNFTITDIQKSSTVITDSVTPTATVSLTNGVVSGTVITTNSIASQSVSYATSAGSATKATQDGDGNTISSTYLKKSGGTMTGTLVTKALEASGTVNIGTASAPYHIVHANDVHAYNGGLESGKVGSSSTNSVAGHLYLYPDANKNTNYIDIRPASGTFSSSRTIFVPNRSGTIALESGIAHAVREYTGTITGDVVRVTHNLGLGTSYRPIVSWNCSTAIVLYGMRNITTNYFELMFASINNYIIGTATGVSVTIRWTY